MKRVKYENPEGAAPAQGLYSHAARVSAGDLLFVAGQLAVARDGGVVGKIVFAAQFQCVFDNLGDVLKGLGASWTDIAKFTTYLHSQDLEQFMALRADLFPNLRRRCFSAQHAFDGRPTRKRGILDRDRGGRRRPRRIIP